VKSSPVPPSWAAFVARTEPDGGLLVFLAVFAGIWGLYDLLDLCWQGTASAYWLHPDGARIGQSLRWVQVGLLVSQGTILLLALVGRARPVPRWTLFLALLAAFALRAVEAWFFFGINDFFYYSVTALIAAQFFTAGQRGFVAAWPKTVLRYQTAWIYLATAMLKLNEHWLSGDHLWIRQRYQAEVLHWPLPAVLAAWMARPAVSRALAWAGAAGELCLGVMLLVRAPRRLVVAAAACLHAFAAAALNVWFFGASMVAQVVFVSGAGQPAEASGESAPTAEDSKNPRASLS
jgi:hypothetical protein